MLSAFARERPFRWDWLLKIAIVLGVLAAAAYLGRRPSLQTLMLLIGAGGALILLYRPNLGLIGLIVAALCVPFAIGTGTQTPIHAVVLLIPAMLVLWVVNMLLRQRVEIVPSAVNLPLAAFAFSVSLSYLAGNLPWNYFAQHASIAAQTGGLMIFLLSAGVFLLMANQIKELRWLEIITWLFLALGALETAGRWVPAIAPIRNLIIVRESEGSLLWVWLIALAGGQALFNTKLPNYARFGLALFIVAAIGRAWLFNRVWVSGWLPPLVVCATLTVLRSRKVALPLLVAAGAYLVFYKPDLIESVLSMKQYSTDTRLVALQIILTQVAPASPIIGLGPANYYFYTPLYPILGYYVSFNSHNQYVDIIAQTGLLGMAVFLWLMATIGKVGWDLRERVQDGFARGYVYGALGGLVGSLFAGIQGDWFLPFVYNIGLIGFRASILGWIFLGGMIAVGQIARKQPTQQATQ